MSLFCSDLEEWYFLSCFFFLFECDGILQNKNFLSTCRNNDYCVFAKICLCRFVECDGVCWVFLCYFAEIYWISQKFLKLKLFAYFRKLDTHNNYFFWSIWVVSSPPNNWSYFFQFCVWFKPETYVLVMFLQHFGFIL